MKVRIIGRKTNPFAKGLFSFDEGGIGNSTKRGYGANFGNLLTRFDVGGSHKSNPHEGIRVGQDGNGNPNLVEEGEVIWNGRKRVNGEEIDNPYVFSNRLMPGSDIIAGVSGSSHKRNKDLGKHISNTIKIKRGSGGDLGVPGDDKLIERQNSEPTEEEMRENFFAYLEQRGISDKSRQQQMYEELMNQKNGNAEGGEQISDDDQEFIQQYLYDQENQEGQEQPEDQEQEEGQEQEEEQQEEDIDQKQNDRITELEQQVQELQQMLQQYQQGAQEQPVDEAAMQQQEVPEEVMQEQMPDPTQMANMGAEGAEFETDDTGAEQEEDSDVDAKMFNDIKQVVDSEYSKTGTVSDDTVYNISKVLKQNNASIKSQQKIFRYIQMLRQGSQEAQKQEGYFKQGGEIKDGYDRLSSAGKALFRMIQNSKGNPDLKEAILQQYNKLPVDDQKILMPLLQNLAKYGGVLFDEGSEMEQEQLQQQLEQEQQAQQPEQQQQEVAQQDQEILAQIQDMLQQVLENPEMQQDQNAMMQMAQQIKQLAQQLSPEGQQQLQQMMQEFAQAMQQQQEQMQQQQQQMGAQEQQQTTPGNQGTGDPNIDRVRQDIPTAAQQQQMDMQQEQQRQQQQQMQMQQQQQQQMKEGGNLYPDGGEQQISEQDQQILAQIQQIAQQQTPEAQQQVQQLAQQLSPQGQQYLMQMVQQAQQQQEQPQGQEQGGQDQNQIIDEILDQAFEKLRENGEEPERYNKTKDGGKSYADVVKDISKEYEERPNDPISKRTLESQMQDLADSQEETRAMKHKEQLDNAFKKMNTQELEEFKNSISQQIQEALGQQGQQQQQQQDVEQQQQEQRQQQQAPEQESEMQLTPEEKEMVDQVIQQQGIDPNSLSQEEYMQAAQQILSTIQEQQQQEQEQLPQQQEPSMQDQLDQQGMSSEGGKFAEGGTANKFSGNNGSVVNIDNLIDDAFRSPKQKSQDNKDRQAVLKKFQDYIYNSEEYAKYNQGDRAAFFNKYHATPDRLVQMIAQDVINGKYDRLIHYDGRDKVPSILDPSSEDFANLTKLSNNTYTMPERQGYDGPPKEDNTRSILHPIVATMDGDKDTALYNISSIYDQLGIDPAKHKGQIIKDLTKVFGKGEWNDLDNGITKSQVDKLLDYYTTANNPIGRKVQESFGSTKMEGYRGLSRNIKDVKEGDLFMSQDGKKLFVKGKDGKGYAITDSKGNIKTEGFKKAGMSADDTADTLALIQKGMYNRSDALRDYKMYGRNMDRTNFLNNLDDALTMSNGKYDNVPSIFKEDRYTLDENGNITHKNGVEATDEDKKFNIFGKAQSIVQEDDRPDRFKGDPDQKQGEFAKFYQDKITEFFNNGEYKKGDKRKPKDYKGDPTLKNQYLTGAEARTWIKQLESSDNKEDQFLAKVLKANWGNSDTDWSDKGAWEFDSSDEKNKFGKLRHAVKGKKGDVRESEAYMRAAAKSHNIEGYDKMNADQLREALRKNGASRLQVDGLWGIEHIPYLSALQNSNKYKMFEVLDKDNNGTGQFIQQEQLPDGYETVEEYKREIKNPNDKGDHSVQVVGVKPKQKNVLVYHNGKLYPISEQEAKKYGLIKMTEDERAKEKIDFNAPTDHVSREYDIYKIDPVKAPEDKKKGDETDPKKKAPGTPFPWGVIPAAFGAFAALADDKRHYDENVYKPQVYTSTVTPHTDFLTYTEPDYQNIDIRYSGLTANTNNQLANLSSGNSGIASAQITNNNQGAISAIGENREKMRHNEQQLYNNVKTQNFSQLHQNDQMLATNSMQNAQNWNTASRDYTQALNNREKDLLQMRYKADRDKDESDSEALKTLANIGNQFVDWKQYKNQLRYMAENGYLDEYLMDKKKKSATTGTTATPTSTHRAHGGIVIIPRRGWSFF